MFNLNGISGFHVEMFHGPHGCVLQRRATIDGEDAKQDVGAAKFSSADIKTSEEEDAQSPSNLVFGYLNLFSDGVVRIYFK